MGKSTFEELVGSFGVGDVLVHTWDLSRATGQDETLDPTEVSRPFALMQPMDMIQRACRASMPTVAASSSRRSSTRAVSAEASMS